MSEKEYLYTISAVCQKGGQIIHNAFYAISVSDERARGVGLRKWKEDCPVEQGFVNHSAVATKIPQAWVDSVATR